eukprot:COSAG02_NODE_514_length_20825_cov_5.990495_5_plen_48_part_00
MPRVAPPASEGDLELLHHQLISWYNIQYSMNPASRILYSIPVHEGIV